ncbi:DUF3322 domain-containing protein [Aquabacterium sp.]|uniref:DUF3322 domain-containing protein n=1 Tax=Aquabacterium sp. TaxID=1872578 RepID=UPI0019CC0CDA|nr:DUF3322 domain-containing protein [Aquabacterium sp.]MBC7699374.1 hypothetical protein [Aquabacterium sp.]
MSEWTSASALREQVRKRWDKGDLLAERVAPEQLFPMRLTLRGPSSGELSDRFDAVREWALELQQGTRHGYRLVMRDVRHRIIGQNSLPAEAWVDTWEEAVRWLGKTSEVKAFDALLAMTRHQQPSLLTWLQRQPLRALALADQWPHLLAFVAWMQAHPKPGIYLRQVDLPGIHSKFIETHRSVLADLLDLVLPFDAINFEASGGAQFARRHGFRDKPLRVRFRWLDPKASNWISGGDGDYTVSQVAFACLMPAVEHVFITENEINFLSFPPVANSLVVFGAGYGFEAWANADWMAACTLHYWGDIDTHGFAILDQLRSHHPHVTSFLMDRETLLAHQPQWTVEPQATLRDLPRLSPEEGALYDDLRWKRLSDQAVRLEQERIDFGSVALAAEACRVAPAS